MTARQGARPQPLGDERAHYWRVQRMARAAGVDLVQTAEAGFLSQDGWAGMIAKCRACHDPAACDRWLDETAADVPGTAAGMCPQRRLFDELQKAIPDRDPDTPA